MDHCRNQRGNKKRYLKPNENKSRTIQNLWDSAKAVLRGKLTAIQCYLMKQEKSQINSLALHLKQPEKEEQTKPQISRRKEIIKITAKIKEIKNNKNISETKSWFFEKINEMDKPLARLIKKKRVQINRIRIEKEVTMDTTEIQTSIRDYYKQLDANTVDNLEIDKFLESYDLSRLNQEETENMNRSIASTEIKTDFKTSIKEKSGTRGLHRKVLLNI